MVSAVELYVKIASDTYFKMPGCYRGHYELPATHSDANCILCPVVKQCEALQKPEEAGDIILRFAQTKSGLKDS